jgi:hypothetical protein
MGDTTDVGAPVRAPEAEPVIVRVRPSVVTRTPIWAKLLVAANIILFAGGWFHFVYGGDSGCRAPILKDGWSLNDTFVDLDDYVGHAWIELLPKAKVLRALVRAEIIPPPPRFGRDRE